MLARPPRRPCLGERPHVLEVRRREPCHVRELPAEIGGETVDDLGAPSLSVLALEDLVPDLPVELDQLAVDRE